MNHSGGQQVSGPMISNVRSTDLGTGRGTAHGTSQGGAEGKVRTKKKRSSISAMDREYGKRYGKLFKDVKDAFGSSEQNRDIGKLLDLLAEKIRAYQKKGTLVEAFRMFVHAGGNGSGAKDPVVAKLQNSAFEAGCKKVNAGFSRTEVDKLFNACDKNGDKGIDFHEFVSELMNDHQQMLRSMPDDVMGKLRNAQKKSLNRLRQMGQTGAGARWQMAELKDMLRERILQKLAGGAGEMRRAFRHFQDSLASREGAITFNSFCHGVRAVGMILPPDQQWSLFNSYDTDGNGMVSFNEFRREVMNERPSDSATSLNIGGADAEDQFRFGQQLNERTQVMIDEVQRVAGFPSAQKNGSRNRQKTMTERRRAKQLRLFRAKYGPKKRRPRSRGQAAARSLPPVDPRHAGSAVRMQRPRTSASNTRIGKQSLRKSQRRPQTSGGSRVGGLFDLSGKRWQNANDSYLYSIQNAPFGMRTK